MDKNSFDKKFAYNIVWTYSFKNFANINYVICFFFFFFALSGIKYLALHNMGIFPIQVRNVFLWTDKIKIHFIIKYFLQPELQYLWSCVYFGDNHTQNCHIIRKSVILKVGNFVLWWHVSSVVKTTLQSLSLKAINISSNDKFQHTVIPILMRRFVFTY